MLKISHSAISSLLYAASMTLKNVTGGCPQHHTIYNVLSAAGPNVLAPYLKQLAIIADEKQGQRYTEKLALTFAAYNLPNEAAAPFGPDRQRLALLALQFAFTMTLPTHHMNKYELNLVEPNNSEVFAFMDRATDLMSRD